MGPEEVPVNGPDFIEQAAHRAVELFARPEGQPQDGVFNAAGFSRAFREVTRVDCTLDGRLVAAMLSGRHSIVRMPDGDHYTSLVMAEVARQKRNIERASDRMYVGDGQPMCQVEASTNEGRPLRRGIR